MHKISWGILHPPGVAGAQIADVVRGVDVLLALVQPVGELALHRVEALALRERVLVQVLPRPRDGGLMGEDVRHVRGLLAPLTSRRGRRRRGRLLIFRDHPIFFGSKTEGFFGGSLMPFADLSGPPNSLREDARKLFQGMSYAVC